MFSPLDAATFALDKAELFMMVGPRSVARQPFAIRTRGTTIGMRSGPGHKFRPIQTEPFDFLRHVAFPARQWLPNIRLPATLEFRMGQVTAASADERKMFHPRRHLLR
jgi:hypothetical protein